MIEISADEPGKLKAEFSELEFNALQYVKQKWGFKDESAVLQFALAILFKAQDNIVEFKDEDGKKQKLSPAEALLAKG
jgi:hypothetical protein